VVEIIYTDDVVFPLFSFIFFFSPQVVSRIRSLK